MKLSIILPVYNVEEYIERCILSLKAQDLSQNDYEIIVVDDGSKDHSIEIAEKLKEEFKNFYIIHKPNGGLSSARNKGIGHAKGEYIWFIDSDDYIEKNVLKSLIDKLETDTLDLLLFNIYDIWPDKECPGFDIKSQPKNIISGLEYIKDGYDIGKSAWCFIVKKSIITDNNILFTEGIIQEDYEFVLKLYKYVNKLTFYPIRVYNYLHRDGSITTTKNASQTLKSIHSWQTIIKNETEFFSDNSDYSRVARYWIKVHKFKALCVLLFNKLPIDVKIREYNKFNELKAFSLKGVKAENLKLRFILSIVKIKPLYYILLHFYRVSKNDKL